METLNPTQPEVAQGNVQQADAVNNEQNVQQVAEQPVQQVTVTPATPSAKYLMPTALAGQPIVAPKPIVAKLVTASARTIGETGESVVILEFAGFKANVIRTMSQVKGDLIEYYNRETLDNMSAVLATASYKKFFGKKNVNITVSYHEAGAIQTIDENSRLYKAGLQPLGTKVPTEKEGIWVEGFLSVELTDAELDTIIERELKAIASAKALEAGFASI